MKKSVLSIAVAASAFAIAPSASAITFASLTTIYVGTGVRDDGAASNAGTATTFHCTNVSGVTTSVRFLVLHSNGTVAASHTQTVAHGATTTISTHVTTAYSEDQGLLTGVAEGAVNIESLQSGVFCNAKTIDASTTAPVGVTLPLVRVNPHPGTVE